MKVEQKVGIRNKFTIHVDDIITGEHKEYQAQNIVLNAMYTRLVNFQTYFVNIHFGTGTGTFTDATRTSLFTHLGTKAATTEFQTRLLPTSQWRRKIVINPDEFVGSTFSEVGVAYGATSSNLVTHAAIKDAAGNPISLGPKTATQVITIYADVFFGLGAFDAMYGGKIRWVQPLANNELLAYLMGGTYPTQQFRVTRAPEFSNGTAPGSHGQSANLLVAGWIKDAANKKVTTPVPATTTRLGVSVGNGEVRGFGLGSSDTAGTFRGQFPITGVFTSKAITGESLGSGDGTKVGFNLLWNDPASLVVKIDDVAVDVGDYDVYTLKKNSIIGYHNAIPLVTGSNTEDNPQDIMDGSTSTGYSVAKNLPMDFVLDLRVQKAWGFSAMRKMNGDVAFQDIRNVNIAVSEDGENWTSEADISFSTGTGNTWEEKAFSRIDKQFRYLKVTVSTSGSPVSVNEIEFVATDDQITFHTPPANGAVITADYTVPYVPKDSNHVLDLQATIQYGEIV